jgi:hypothetical protein
MRTCSTRWLSRKRAGDATARACGHGCGVRWRYTDAASGAEEQVASPRDAGGAQLLPHGGTMTPGGGQ